MTLFFPESGIGTAGSHVSDHEVLGRIVNELDREAFERRFVACGCDRCKERRS